MDEFLNLKKVCSLESPKMHFCSNICEFWWLFCEFFLMWCNFWNWKCFCTCPHMDNHMDIHYNWEDTSLRSWGGATKILTLGTGQQLYAPFLFGQHVLLSGQCDVWSGHFFSISVNMSPLKSSSPSWKWSIMWSNLIFIQDKWTTTIRRSSFQ